MYLSRLELNPRSREARRDLARPYELHRTLTHAFPTPEGQDYRVTHGVLFRIEATIPGSRPVVLVQSTTEPNWARLPADYLHQTAQCKPLNLAPAQGQVLGFRLVANPTKKVARPDHRQGSRVPLLDVGGAEDGTPAQHWLHRKASCSGFEVLHVFSEGFSLSSARASHHHKSQLPLYGVRFDGILRVTDPALITTALSQGIGSAKAFGFGLLSLASSNGNNAI